MAEKTSILCIGEILWDGLPSGLYLGGAPLNVCYHLNQFNINSVIASRVGEDRLGKEAIRRIERKGILTDYIQNDSHNETGFVSVELDQGDPDYNFVDPVAWDYIELTERLDNTVEGFWGLVFGSLAQRNAQSRATIQALWDKDITKILDMNLREPYIDRDVIHDSLTAADIVKMNEDELNQLKDWYALSGETRKAVEELTTKFDCPLICVTRGANGATVYSDGEWHDHKGFPTKVRDAVGAGDAFLAALLYGITNDHQNGQLLPFANATGALVAQKDGATPFYTIRDVLFTMKKKGRGSQPEL